MSPEKIMTDILHSLVEDKDAVLVEATVTRKQAIYDVEVSEKDIGKVLGRKGICADALRVLFGAIYGKSGRKLHLTIVQAEGNN